MQIVNVKTKKRVSIMNIVAMIIATNFEVLPKIKKLSALSQNPFVPSRNSVDTALPPGTDRICSLSQINKPKGLYLSDYGYVTECSI
jgi:hypothetical protein